MLYYGSDDEYCEDCYGGDFCLGMFIECLCEIQSIVLTSENNEPCILIRLIRIAIVPDMFITAYFIAD